MWSEAWTYSKVRPSNWPCCTKWFHRLVPSSKGREFLLLYSSKLKQSEPRAIIWDMRAPRYASVWAAYSLCCMPAASPCMHTATVTLMPPLSPVCEQCILSPYAVWFLTQPLGKTVGLFQDIRSLHEHRLLWTWIKGMKHDAALVILLENMIPCGSCWLCQHKSLQ